MEKKIIAKKIVLVGDFSTGKTSLIRRFVDNSFSDAYLSTLGVKVSTKAINVTHGTVRGLIWDIEGGTEQKPMNPSYLQGAHGAIVVADVTRQSSIDHIADYLEKVQRQSIRSIVLALNKIDLINIPEAQTIQDALHQQWPQVNRIFLTSAKTGENVEVMFQHLADALVEG